jgi:hypothetical protein
MARERERLQHGKSEDGEGPGVIARVCTPASWQAETGTITVHRALSSNLSLTPRPPKKGRGRRKGQKSGARYIDFGVVSVLLAGCHSVRVTLGH